MKNFICVICPKGCRLSVDEDNGYAVSGNACSRGKDYGMQEAKSPSRSISSTVRVESAQEKRCPVKTDKPIPKSSVMEAVKQLNNVCLRPPIQIGDVVLKNICGTNASFVATKDIMK